MEKQIKITVNLTLDREKERDMIEQIESLLANRQLSYFVTNLVKFGLENPSLLEQAHIESSKVLMANSRVAFFEDVKSQIKAMNERIEAVEEASAKTYELARLGKKLGLENKSKTDLRAALLLKRHMEELRKGLGYSDYEFNERWMRAEKEEINLEDKAEELLEFVIEHYDGVVSEIIEENRAVVRREAENENVRKLESESVSSDIEQDGKEKDKQEEESEQLTDKPVKVNLDLDALGDFFS